jgi:Ser/Thr protein kinase RdoA (MazF antagonist)
VLAERLPTFQRTLAAPPAAAALLAERVTTALRALPTVPPVLCHRDFYDKQVLLDRERGTLIDLDLAATGHPALDVGNWLAHARLRALKGAPLPWSALARAIAAEARRDRGIDGALGAWTASPLLRLALIYSRRARRPGLIAALLDSAEAALAQGGEWQGIL